MPSQLRGADLFPRPDFHRLDRHIVNLDTATEHLYRYSKSVRHHASDLPKQRSVAGGSQYNLCYPLLELRMSYSLVVCGILMWPVCYRVLKMDKGVDKLTIPL